MAMYIYWCCVLCCGCGCVAVVYRGFFVGGGFGCVAVACRRVDGGFGFGGGGVSFVALAVGVLQCRWWLWLCVGGRDVDPGPFFRSRDFGIFGKKSRDFPGSRD